MRLRIVCILCSLSVATNGIEDFIQGTRMQEPEKAIATERQKRGLPSVIEKLLGKANLVNKFGSYRQYSKNGGFDQALIDFQSLKATHITRTVTSQRGQVGDTTVLMDKGVHKGKDYTALTFMRNPDLPRFKNEVRVDTIRYFE